MPSFLITGAAGFIGSHLCEYYLKKNFEVFGIDNLLTGNIKNISHLFNNERFHFICEDLCNFSNFDKKIDYILHFASPASPVDFVKYPLETLKVNSHGTEKILKLGLENNATVLVASTSEIYGDPQIHPQIESYYGNVNTVGPRSVYDEGKRYLETITYAYKNLYNLNVRIIRIFNTYGPKMRVDDGRVIPNFINQALTNNPFSIYGNGQQTRSFCYIDDLIEGIDKLLNSNYMLPINIGNTDEIKILDLINIISEIIPNNNKLIFSKISADDPKLRRPSIELAKKQIGWSPKTKLKEGLIKTINYFKNN
tara:strand:+ start:186 stop:1115 length:930 start_codon:yes stop_codon:yes gene_type:complete